MPSNHENAPAPVKPEIADMRTCPGCATRFPPGGRGLGKVFCNDQCRKRFHAHHNNRGLPIAHLVKAWNATRHATPGTREADICRFARSELTAIARSLLEEDEEAGRDVVAYVGTLMDSGTLWVDRRR